MYTYTGCSKIIRLFFNSVKKYLIKLTTWIVVDILVAYINVNNFAKFHCDRISY